MSDLYDEYHLQPRNFYCWQKQFFENGKIQQLEAKLTRKHEVLSKRMEEHIMLKKRIWGALTGNWVPYDIRDAVVDYVKDWSNKTKVPLKCFTSWLSVSKSISD